MRTSIEIPPFGEALAANGGTDGYVTVASTTPYYPGATAWLSDTTGRHQHVLITDILSATKMGVRFIEDEVTDTKQLGYGKNDASAFTTVNGARIDMPRQVVRIDRAFSKFTPP